jgi:hypothetical protein
MVPPGFDPSGLLCDVMDSQAAGCCMPGVTHLRQQQSRTRVASNARRGMADGFMQWRLNWRSLLKLPGDFIPES